MNGNLLYVHNENLIAEIVILAKVEVSKTKIFRGFAPAPIGGAYSAPQTPQLFLNGPTGRFDAASRHHCFTRQITNYSRHMNTQHPPTHITLATALCLGVFMYYSYENILQDKRSCSNCAVVNYEFHQQFITSYLVT